ncbi:MAG: hypothetical protein SPE56_08510 [Prevotella sp.]|nr:hypothetical protein [Prevotella sp.]
MRNLLTLLLIALTLGSLRAQDDVMSLTTENGLSDNSVTAFLMDRSGYMFIGTQLAVDRFDGENIVSIGFDNQRASARNMVSAMVEEDDDHLVVGNGIGLWRLDKQRLKMKRIFADRIDGPVIRMERYKGKIYIQTQRLLFCLIDGQLTQIRQIHWHHSPTLPQSNVRWRMHQSRSVNSAQYYDAAAASGWPRCRASSGPTSTTSSTITTAPSGSRSPSSTPTTSSSQRSAMRSSQPIR